METLAAADIVGRQPRSSAAAPQATKCVRLEDILQRTSLLARGTLDEQAAETGTGFRSKPEPAIRAIVCTTLRMRGPDVPRKLFQMAFPAGNNKAHRHDEGPLARFFRTRRA